MGEKKNGGGGGGGGGGKLGSICAGMLSCLRWEAAIQVSKMFFLPKKCFFPCRRKNASEYTNFPLACATMLDNSAFRL